MANKILIVCTGGTMGGNVENNVIDVCENANYTLLDMYSKLDDKLEVDFDTIQPINILSEDATVEHWRKISASIKSIDITKYIGIIILYGTDTLGYAANALSYLLYDIDIPIMMASSTYVLTDKKSNGLENFKTAVKFIVEENCKGVFVPFKNHNGEIYIHAGTRVKQIGQLSNSIYSICDVWFAHVVNNKIARNPDYDINNHKKYEYNFVICDDVLYIKQTVGMKYDFNLDKYKIVFIEVFHASTVSTASLKLIKECKSMGILVFIGPIYKDRKVFYAPTRKAMDEWAIPITNMSMEAILAKLMIAGETFKTNEEIRDFMSKNIIGEVF